MKPTVGRIVHFFCWLEPARPIAAMVTRVYEFDPEKVDLELFGSPAGVEKTQSYVSLLLPNQTAGGWMWPPGDDTP